MTEFQINKNNKYNNKNLYRLYDKINKDLFSQTVVVNGWIKTIRTQSSMFFISLNDGSDARNIQITDEISEFDIVSTLTTGTAIQVIGIVVESPSAGQSFEIKPSIITSYGSIKNLTEYPIAKSKLGIDFLRTLPHLRSRTNFFSSVNRIRHSMMKATHDFYDTEGFLHLDPNILKINECEGGAGVFTVTEMLDKKVSETPSDKAGNIDWSSDHFKRRVFLTVSSQLNLEGLALSHYRFREKLKSRAFKFGCKITEVTEYLTSKTCSNCLEINDNLGSSKIFKCSCCNLLLDRDINASINIYKNKILTR